MKKSSICVLLILLFTCVKVSGSTNKKNSNNTPHKKESKSKKRFAKPILGGTPVGSTSQIPYQILISGGTDGGGTLVSKRWILTAAHVANVSGLFLKGGITNRSQAGQSRIFKSRWIHPKYNDNSSSTIPSNDIALILVEQPFSGLSAVKLASDNNSSLWAITNPQRQAQVS